MQPDKVAQQYVIIQDSCWSSVVYNHSDCFVNKSDIRTVAVIYEM